MYNAEDICNNNDYVILDNMNTEVQYHYACGVYNDAFLIFHGLQYLKQMKEVK